MESESEIPDHQVRERVDERGNIQAQMLADIAVIQDFYDRYSNVGGACLDQRISCSLKLRQTGGSAIPTSAVPVLLTELHLRLPEEAVHAICGELDRSKSGEVSKSTFQIWWINTTQENIRHSVHARGSVASMPGRSPIIDTSDKTPQLQQLLGLEIPDVSNTLHVHFVARS